MTDRRTPLLSVLIVAVFAAATWTLAIGPSNAEIADLNDETVRLEDQLAQSQVRVAQLERIEADADLWLARQEAAEALVPGDVEFIDLFDRMQAAADRSNVTIRLVSPERPQKVEGESVPAGTAALPFTIETSGSWANTAQFLSLLEDPEVVPRAMLWRNVSVSPQDEGSNVFIAQMSGEVFARLPVGFDSDPATLAREAAEAEAAALEAEAEGDEDE